MRDPNRNLQEGEKRLLQSFKNGQTKNATRNLPLVERIFLVAPAAATTWFPESKLGPYQQSQKLIQINRQILEI
jgi:hypothetical protein